MHGVTVAAGLGGHLELSRRGLGAGRLLFRGCSRAAQGPCRFPPSADRRSQSYSTASGYWLATALLPLEALLSQQKLSLVPQQRVMPNAAQTANSTAILCVPCMSLPCKIRCSTSQLTNSRSDSLIRSKLGKMSQSQTHLGCQYRVAVPNVLSQLVQGG